MLLWQSAIVCCVTFDAMSLIDLAYKLSLSLSAFTVKRINTCPSTVWQFRLITNCQSSISRRTELPAEYLYVWQTSFLCGWSIGLELST